MCTIDPREIGKDLGVEEKDVREMKKKSRIRWLIWIITVILSFILGLFVGRFIGKPPEPEPAPVYPYNVGMVAPVAGKKSRAALLLASVVAFLNGAVAPAFGQVIRYGVYR
jgi:vacuolar-type H+-ATPase subunit I/STV1